MKLVTLELGCVHSGFVDQNSTKILMSAQLYPGPESYGFSVKHKWRHLRDYGLDSLDIYRIA